MFDREFSSISKVVVGAFIIWTLGVAATVAVVAHFISKFW